MPFHPSCTNPTIDGTTLHVTYDGLKHSFKLDNYLQNVDGRFVWDSKGGFSGSVKTGSLKIDRSGMLSAELRKRSGYVPATIDLGEKINVVGGKLAVRLRETTSGASSDPIPSPPASPASPPPAYNEFFEGFRKYKTETFKSKSYAYEEYEQRSSGWMKYSVDELTISGAELTAIIRLPTGGKNTSKFDLTNHIGVVRGRLIWGRRGFVKDCKTGSLKIIDKFTLQAECYADKKRGQVQISTLDLSRYLQVFDGKLDIKVIDTTEVEELFSEAKWMKLRVINEPSPEMLLDVGAFRSAFRSIAETVVEHVVKEVTDEFKGSSAEQIKNALKDNNSRGKVVENVKEIVDKHVTELMEKEVEQAFEDAKKRVMDACGTMKEKAIEEVTKELSADNTPEMEKALTEGVDGLMTQSLLEVSALAIAQFQQRAEILMERELFRASMRSARTQASFFKRLAEQVECSMGLHTNWDDDSDDTI